MDRNVVTQKYCYVTGGKASPTERERDDDDFGE